jgi:hypothetical protein
MTNLLDEAIAKARQLPEDEQNAAAGALLDYINTMQDLQLTDEQLAEVRRRRADPNRTKIPVDEAFRKILGG